MYRYRVTSSRDPAFSRVQKPAGGSLSRPSKLFAGGIRDFEPEKASVRRLQNGECWILRFYIFGLDGLGDGAAYIKLGWCLSTVENGRGDPSATPGYPVLLDSLDRLSHASIDVVNASGDER